MARPDRLHRPITLERLEKFVNRLYFANMHPPGQLYNSRAMAAALGLTVVELDEAAALELAVYSCADPKARPLFAAVRDQVHAQPSLLRPARVGESFGPTWSTHWFHVRLSLADGVRRALAAAPADLVEDLELHFVWDSESEALLLIDGEPRLGFNGSDGCDRRAEFVIWPPPGLPLGAAAPPVPPGFECWVEMAANGSFGAGAGGMIQPPDPTRTYRLRVCTVRLFDRLAGALLHDCALLYDAARLLPEDSHRGREAMRIANDIINLYNPDSRESWRVCRAQARTFLSARAQSDEPCVHHVLAMGHCHIDTAWLWPYAETRRKTARSWASVLEYMTRESRFTFVISQAQQIEWLRLDYPNLFERLRGAVAAGRIIPVGGSWVEFDANMPSGEAMVRQFTLGQRATQQAFGSRASVFWLPDTFGYSGALPQLVRLAGMNLMVTQKLSWNLFNRPVHATFLWQGIDGTAILTHFPPASTYNAQASLEEVLTSERKNTDSERGANASLLLYGNGDGGGGPLPDMFERLDRLAHVPGIARVRHASPADFVAAVHPNAAQLTRWVGELYFELHQGTFTSQAATKNGNRQAERMLREAELVCALACAATGAAYPAHELQSAWEKTLLNQFHDVLPGSSIAAVYADVAALYAQVSASLAPLIARGLAALAAALLRPGAAGREVLLNTLSWDVALVSPAGAYCQVPSIGLAAPAALALPHGGARGAVSADGRTVVLENGLVRASLDAAARLQSFILLSSGRDALRPGEPGNVLMLLADEPFYWDAWDFMSYSHERSLALPGYAAVEALAPPVLTGTGARITARFAPLALSAQSSLVLSASLEAGSAVVLFDAHVSWHEAHKMLRVVFPLDVLAARATYEIQFGHIERPTHYNTSWDAAKYEVCAQRWGHLGEVDYGVALLSRDKYGMSCHASTLGLSLLRAPKAPDAACDMGEHDIRYGLTAHVGALQHSVIARAYEMTFHPPACVASEQAAGDADALSFLRLEPPGTRVIIEAVKCADDGTGALILRLYEAWGARSPELQLVVHSCLVRRACVLAAAWVSIFEEAPALQADGGALLVSPRAPGSRDWSVVIPAGAFHPFQVRTLRLESQPEP